MSDPESSERTLASVSKAFDIVEHLWRNEGAGVTELADGLELPKSTVHVHLSTLASKGYVVRRDGGYALSFRFLTLGESVKRAEPLTHAAAAPVEDLAERTDETVLCMTEQNGLGMVLNAAKGERSLPSEVDVGTAIYHHCSAGGKAMMAHYPDEKVDAIVDRWGLPAFTDRTITDRDALFEELETVREEGVAYNDQEYLRGVMAVGAPVFGDNDTVRGAVTVSGPARRLLAEHEDDDLVNTLRAATNTIEVNLLFDT